ncbi:glycosyl-transferase for dystroglycan-domain-containing protein [Pelagophyceae sp. CCMP2097]|nr:glycosyl-transferase for dystroglycan-domain-containing protein [Pelagophyceae sp. CCMP2097]
MRCSLLALAAAWASQAAWANEGCPICDRCVPMSVPPWFPLADAHVAAHVVVTRIALGEGRDHTKSVAQFELFKAVCFPSMLAQVDKSFVWIIYIDETFPACLAVQLRVMVSPHGNFRVAFARSDDLNSTLSVGSAMGHFLYPYERLRKHGLFVDAAPNTHKQRVSIRTRLDSDHGLHKCAIAKVHAELSRRAAKGSTEGTAVWLGWQGAASWYPPKREDRNQAGKFSAAPNAVAHGVGAPRSFVASGMTRATYQVSRGSKASGESVEWLVLQGHAPLRVKLHGSYHGAALTNEDVYGLGVQGLLRLAGKVQDGGRDPAMAKLAASCDAKAHDVTLLVQSSKERLWSVNVICKRWQGPMVIIVHGVSGGRNGEPFWLPDLAKAPPFGKSVVTDEHYIARASLEDCASYVRIGVVSPTAEETEDANLYPVNKLRNTAIDAVETSHYMAIDADFWPNAALYANLLNATQYPAKLALVVPAFQIVPFAKKSDCRHGADCMEQFEHLAPQTFKQLLVCVESANCDVFNVVQNMGGHSSTGYLEWFKQTDQLRMLPCVASERWEPYVMLRKAVEDRPRYDERYTGYGKNKISHTLELRLRNYTFAVLQDAYLTHVPHPSSEAKQHFSAATSSDSDATHRARMNDLFEKLAKKVFPQRVGTRLNRSNASIQL